MSAPIRAGDTVHHRPSGETWTVASVDGDHFYACGYPETRALVRDVDLVERGTDEEHERLLRAFAKDGNGSGRSSAARRNLAALAGGSA